MSSSLLLEKYIKVSVRKALKEQEEQLKKQEKSVYLIYRFPGFRKAMIDLLSPAFSRYITNVTVIAPKPTTFNIALVNGMDFYMIYMNGGSFIAKIQGKKYNLSNLGETERASQSIANMLELNYTPQEELMGMKNTKKDDMSGDNNLGSSSSSSIDDQSLVNDLTSAEELPDNDQTTPQTDSNQELPDDNAPVDDEDI